MDTRRFHMHKFDEYLPYVFSRQDIWVLRFREVLASLFFEDE